MIPHAAENHFALLHRPAAAPPRRRTAPPPLRPAAAPPRRCTATPPPCYPASPLPCRSAPMPHRHAYNNWRSAMEVYSFPATMR